MKVFLELTDEITEAQVCIERVETVLGEVVDEYFNNLSNNPDTQKGKELIALFFNQNRILSDIARDCVIQLHHTLNNMENTVKQGRDEHSDPIGRLDGLNVAAIRRGKGEELIKVLERHGVESYAGLPLSKYHALEADLIGLVMGSDKVI